MGMVRAAYKNEENAAKLPPAPPRIQPPWTRRSSSNPHDAWKDRAYDDDGLEAASANSSPIPWRWSQPAKWIVCLGYLHWVETWQLQCIFRHMKQHCKGHPHALWMTDHPCDDCRCGSQCCRVTRVNEEAGGGRPTALLLDDHRGA